MSQAKSVEKKGKEESKSKEGPLEYMPVGSELVDETSRDGPPMVSNWRWHTPSVDLSERKAL